MRAKKKNPLDLFKSAETTGELIKAFRESHNITQEQMAKACKIGQANLSAIEADRRPVGPQVALKLAAVMGLSPDIILFPNGYESEPVYRTTRTHSATIIPMFAKRK